MRPQFGKEKILRAAVKLFAEKGYHTTSVSHIAMEAGVSKGLTYNYFKSKEELLLAIINKASEDMFDVAGTMFGQGSYQETLYGFLENYFSLLKTQKTYLSFQLSLIFQPDLKEIVSAPLQKRADFLLSLTEKMFREAGINEPHIIARRFMSELDGIALHYLSLFKDYPLDPMQNQLYKNYKDLEK